MPFYILVIDYILGIIMWTLIGRSAMNIFQREDSEFFFRFYLMPYLMGYSVMGMLSFPLESEIAGEIYRLFGKN